eukprot:scaffold5905_cov132-Isochrysis_galbana.AAC.4
MVQPVVNEMFATVHAAGSSLLGLFTSCTAFDSTATHLDLCAGSLSPIATETRTRPFVVFTRCDTFVSAPPARDLSRSPPVRLASCPTLATGSFFAGVFDALPDPHPGALLVSSSSFSRYSTSSC